MSSLIHRLVPTGALRNLAPKETPRVTNMELFFDLVYVFTMFGVHACFVLKYALLKLISTRF